MKVAPFEPVGFWGDKDWKTIAEELKSRLNYSHLEVLFSDGGPGIQENLMEEGMRHQRCIYHGKRDFKFILYADGLKKDQQQPFLNMLFQIPAMAVKATTIDHLDPGKYPKARTYIQNLSESVTTFFDYWLESKSWLPTTTNAIESLFSRITNRIKAIGKRWSEEGLLLWLHVNVQKLFYPESWKQLWDQYLQVNFSFELVYLKVQYQWL